MSNNFDNHRMSALPFTQFCAKAGQLSGGYASMSARESSAFHAKTAQSPGWEAKVALLTDEEETEIKTWRVPTEVNLEGVVLRYADAEKEVELGLTADLGYCGIYDPQAVTRGHMDHGWVVKFKNGETWVFVVDIKRSEWTVREGPDSLQVNAYGFAFAAKHDADVYVPCIWAATEGTYWWGKPMRLASREAIRMGERILAAATNLPTKDNQYTYGAHCSGCYGRMRCPAWLMPPELAVTELAPFTEAGLAKDLDPEVALQLLLKADRAEETAKAVKKELKERIRRGLPIADQTRNLVYRAVMCKGRAFEFYDVEAAKKDGVDIEKYKKEGRGAPYDQLKWVKP